MPARAQRLEPANLDNTPPCPQAEATLMLAAEVRKLRMSVRAGIRQVQPACTAVRGFCSWWRKWRLVLLAGAPSALLGVNALTPQAAKALAEILKAFAGS